MNVINLQHYFYWGVIYLALKFEYKISKLLIYLQARKFAKIIIQTILANFRSYIFKQKYKNHYEDRWV